jgi:phosphatidylserine/phosphatidylglycerophosphate/cardiolipin synthase-like enzyme
MRRIIQKTLLPFAVIQTAQASFGQTPPSASKTQSAPPQPPKVERPSVPAAAKAGGVLANNALVRTYFAPNVPLAEEIVKEIAKARYSIMVQAHKFTSETISQALNEARKSGVTVEAIFDKDYRILNKETFRASAGDNLLSGGIPVYIDSGHAVHSNLMIIDNRLVITGSYSFTDAEKTVAENIVIIDSAQIAGEYAANWARRRDYSTVSGIAAAKAPKPASVPKPRTDPRPDAIKSGLKRPNPPARPKSK